MKSTRKWILGGIAAVVAIAASIFLIGYFAGYKCDPRIARLADPNFKLAFNEREAQLRAVVAEIGPTRAIESAKALARQPRRPYYKAVFSEAIRQWKPIGKTQQQLREFLEKLADSSELNQREKLGLPGAPDEFDHIEIYGFEARTQGGGTSGIFWIKNGVIIHYDP